MTSTEPLEGEIVPAAAWETPRGGRDAGWLDKTKLDALVASWLGNYTGSANTARTFAAWLGAPPHIRKELPSSPKNPQPADDTTWLGWCAAKGVDPLAPMPHHVTTWLGHTAQAVAAGRFSPATRVDRYRAMSLFLGWCMEYRHIEPVWLPGPNERKRHGVTGSRTRRTVGLPDAGAALLWAAEHDDRPLPSTTRRTNETPQQRRLRSTAIVSILIGSGMRVSELTGASYQSYWRNPDGSGTIRITGKGGKLADQPIAAWAADALDAYLRDGRVVSTGTVIERSNGSRSGDVPLIANGNGQNMSGDTVYSLLQRLALLPKLDSDDPGEREHAAALAQLPRNAKGKPRIGAHKLRHAAAHQVLDDGGNVQDVMDLLRHANIATSQVYTESRGSRAAQVAARLSKPGSKKHETPGQKAKSAESFTGALKPVGEGDWTPELRHGQA